MEVEQSSQILESVASITSYIQETGGHPAQEGIVLLAMEYPELKLMKGDVDLVALLAEEFHEDETITYSAGWIGGGAVQSAWLESDDGTVIDPWLHERIASGFPDGKLAQLPVIFATRNYEGPIGICYGKGEEIPLQGAEEIHEKYRKWVENWDITTASYPFARYILDNAGIEKHAQSFAWANAVVTIDEREGPPLRRMKIEAEVTQERPSVRQPQILNAVKPSANAFAGLALLEEKRKLSPMKAIVAAGIGVAAGYFFLWVF